MASDMLKILYINVNHSRAFQSCALQTSVQYQADLVITEPYIPTSGNIISSGWSVVYKKYVAILISENLRYTVIPLTENTICTITIDPAFSIYCPYASPNQDNIDPVLRGLSALLLVEHRPSLLFGDFNCIFKVYLIFVKFFPIFFFNLNVFKCKSVSSTCKLILPCQ